MWCLVCSRIIVKYRIYLVPHLHSKPRALATHGISSLNTTSRCRTGRFLLRLGFLALDLIEQFRATLRTRRFFRNRGTIVIISRSTRLIVSFNSIWVCTFRFQNVKRDENRRANTNISTVSGILSTVFDRLHM